YDRRAVLAPQPTATLAARPGEPSPVLKRPVGCVPGNLEPLVIQELDMSERAWRFITTMLTALSAAMAFAHLLELPPKMRYEARLYVTVQKSLYQLSGTIGAVFEV